MGTVNVAVSWNIQQPLPEFKYLLLLPLGIHSKESTFLMPWSLYTLYVNSQQCLGSYTPQTQVRRNAPGLQWDRSRIGPQEWDEEDITNPAPSAAPSAGTHGEKWVIGAVLWWNLIGENTWGRRQMQALTKWPEAACTREQQDGSWCHMWPERDSKHLSLQLSRNQPSIKHCKVKTLKSFETGSPFFYKVLPFN